MCSYSNSKVFSERAKVMGNLRLDHPQGATGELSICGSRVVGTADFEI